MVFRRNYPKIVKIDQNCKLSLISRWSVFVTERPSRKLTDFCQKLMKKIWVFLLWWKRTWAFFRPTFCDIVQTSRKDISTAEIGLFSKFRLLGNLSKSSPIRDGSKLGTDNHLVFSTSLVWKNFVASESFPKCRISIGTEFELNTIILKWQSLNEAIRISIEFKTQLPR